MQPCIVYCNLHQFGHCFLACPRWTLKKGSQMCLFFQKAAEIRRHGSSRTSLIHVSLHVAMPTYFEQSSFIMRDKVCLKRTPVGDS